MTLTTLTLASLACWRLAIMLTEDGGPYRVFQRLRAFLKRKAKTSPAVAKSDVAEGIHCIRCSSVWVAGPIAAVLEWPDPLRVGLGWFAISGAAILINRALPAT